MILVVWISKFGISSLYKEEALWYLIMQVVKLAECDIYSYNPDSDADPFLERGAMWVFEISSLKTADI